MYSDLIVYHNRKRNQINQFKFLQMNLHKIKLSNKFHKVIQTKIIVNPSFLLHLLNKILRKIANKIL
jgi:hypothetical protein